MKAIIIILFALLASCSLTVHVHTYEKVTKEVGFKPCTITPSGNNAQERHDKKK